MTQPGSASFRSLAWTLAAAGLLLTGVAQAQAQSPNPGLLQAMKEHIAKQLTDEQIRELHRKAGVMQVEETKRIEAESQARQKQRMRTQEQCKDVVYRTRNERECQAAHSTLWTLSVEGPRSREQIFEDLLLGLCNFAGQDRKRLLQMNCLPPDSPFLPAR